MAFILYCLLVALNFAALSLQDTKDPLIDFCRRFGHQTAVIDRRLYIDGGLVNWNPISQNPLNYTSKLTHRSSIFENYSVTILFRYLAPLQ